MCKKTTDKEKVEKLFDELGIGHVVFDSNRGDYVCVSLEQGNERIVGYAGFRADFNFDKQGTFIRVNIYE